MGIRGEGKGVSDGEGYKLYKTEIINLILRKLMKNSTEYFLINFFNYRIFLKSHPYTEHPDLDF